jgi:hypothetical protein
MKWNNSFLLISAVCLSQFAYGLDTAKLSDKLITISGKVLTLENKPVAGAVLYIDNIKTNITTKTNGSYRIKVSPSALNLEVRSADFKSCETAISGKTTINFTLERLNNQVSKSEEITKEAGMQDKIKKSSTTKGKKMNTYNDIYQMIRGEVNGVMVSGRSIQIQQGHSFFGSGTPLFVVNGNIVPSIDNINPIEVKSIGVLKGSAASVYGVNGANGVITIVLKNGTEKE